MALFTRPYRMPASMVVLLAIVPAYIFIPELLAGRTLHAPQLPLDRAIPLVPAWALVYGATYLFLILLPILLVRDQQLLRAAARTYLAAWLIAYACFVAFPTVAPRPSAVGSAGFWSACLGFLYAADTRFNCFPSLHVAHSFISALVCRRVHRGVGRVCLLAAAMVGISTLFTKQHYVLDVVSGVALAIAASALFLRRDDAAVPAADRRIAPLVALLLGCAMLVAAAVPWLVYQTGH